MDLMIDYKKGMVNHGDCSRFRKVMQRAQKGEEIKVAFLGGSITQGYLATDKELCYAALTAKWWKDTFPQAKIDYINAGIGGTTSHFGVSRVAYSVLEQQADVIFVEFSVNDSNDEFFKETYEGLVRKILNAPGKPALMLLHNVIYNTGYSAEEIHGEIGRYYNVPAVSIKASIYDQMLTGAFGSRDVTEDDLHPNNTGHRLIAETIGYFLDEIRKECVSGEEKEEKPLPAPLTMNAYEDCVRFQSADFKAHEDQYEDRKETASLALHFDGAGQDEFSAEQIAQGKDKERIATAFFAAKESLKGISVSAEGFEEDRLPKRYYTDSFRGGWSAKKPGDEIKIRFTGSEFAVQYRRTVKRPALIAEAVVDGDTLHTVVLDANFHETWGDCLTITPVLRHGKIVTGQTREGVTPAAYETSMEALSLLRDEKPVAEEHEIVIRITGVGENPAQQDGFALIQDISGGAKKEEEKDTVAANEPETFDLVSILISGPAEEAVSQDI